MDSVHCGLLVFVFFLQINCLHSVYITDNTDSLHRVLSEFGVVRPIRTNSEGRFLSASVSAHRLHRSKRHAPSANDIDRSKEDAPSTRDTLWVDTSTNSTRSNHSSSGGAGRTGNAEGEELFYNVTVFGQELHLRLRPNLRLVAPAATMEWWEESGQKRSQRIGEAGCFYTGEVSNMADTSVAISNCDGLAGLIRTSQDEFFIEPMDQWKTDAVGDEEEEEGGRRHIVYRSSAIVARNQQAANQTEADDFMPGPLLGSMNLYQNALPSQSGFTRRRRYIEEAELFNIEVLLAVDYTVLLFHGRDHIQKYLLTMMNIVNEIYQDHSLGANINIVLVRITILSPSKSQELISVGNAQRSLENVCGWSYLQQREQSHAEQHDHTIYLTRQEFGPSGMQGYAPVTGMCHLHRSCVLVFEDGFASAFVAAHETGHVLGMEHDGEANDCDDDVSLGSIMSPRVQATFHRYHWSRCSWRELHKYLHTYDCLRDDPFHHDWPAQPQLPGFQYSMDQQCRFDFGPGYSTCTAYPNHEPCKKLWCSDYNNPFFCKTKKGPPLDGTKCAPGKHCFKGYCMKLTPNLLRQDGSWGGWSSYGSCSRTCGGGVRFRTRRCDNPAPANGGRTCFGNSFEFQLCSQDKCPPMTDFRADQCEVWNHFFEHEGEKHHWLPIEHPDPDERCRLFCQSNETSAVVSMNRMVHDGTPCSYSDPYSVCVRGECEQVGCDGQIASDKQEDRCGVCGGDNSSCKIVKGNFTRSTKKPGYLKILEIPKGARHLLVQEFKATPHVLAVKNLETGHLFLNDEEDSTESRVVIEKGVAWEYTNSEEDEHIQTTGPLKYGVLLMIRSQADTKVTVSYKYIIEEGLQIHKENEPMVKDSMFYEWALKRWSQCSKPCGGGKQYTRFGCRRKADGKMVHRMFCSDIHKPRAISRSCNTDTCSTPRWVSGEWEDCSASCGQTGWQRRWVSCQQASSKGQLRSVNSKLCGDGRPDTKQPCNRNPCPATWRAGPWTPCTVSCGNGTQERQVACFSPEGEAGNCSLPAPITSRICRLPPCGGDHKNITPWLSRSNVDFPMPKLSYSKRCRGDRSVFCRMESLSRYCRIPGYRQMCCKSCGNFSSSVSPTSNSRSWTLTTETVTLSSNFTTISDIISTPSSSFTEAPPPTTATTITTAPPTTTKTTTIKDSTDFVYVDYEDYNEYSSYEESAEIPSTASPYVPSTVTAPTMPPQKTDPTSLLWENNTSSLNPVPMVTADHEKPTQTPVRISAVPELPTTVMMADDIITSASPSDTTSGERGVKIKTKPNKTEPPPVLFVPSSKRENNSVDEVPYRIVGLDSDIPRGQQNYFVPRMPRFRERTQNKRIQELLNEKRRQDLLKRVGRNSRTEQKRSGL